jgi:glycine/D-amino acid oxidase-like deaminating enzyme
MGKFVAGLADVAARRGARIYEHAAVTGLRRINGHAHEVISAKGKLVASKVLIATGPSVTGPFAHFRRRIVPVGSFIIATEPLAPSVLDEIMPTRRTATTTKNIGHYFRISPDNRLIFGGRTRFALSGPSSDAMSGRILEAGMRTTFPMLKTVRTEFCWGGLVDMTSDRLPRAGEHNGAFYSMGYSGHGTQMAILMGKAIAEVMQGNVNANPMRGLAWPAIPGHFGHPWFLPLVGAYYRFQDWLR